VLTQEGFTDDASQHDSPRIRGRIASAGVGPHQLEGGGLWEFPVAVWRSRHVRLPVGGASYWGFMPNALILHGLGRSAPLAGLYLHPHEFDPRPLRARLPGGTAASQRVQARLRATQRNAARRRAPDVVRAIGGRFHLIPYGAAYAQLSGGAPARP
jgi:hypothetical protein